MIGSQEGYNTGRCALHPGHPANQAFISYHSWLIVTLESLPDAPMDFRGNIRELRETLRSSFLDEIERLEDIKELEWEAQQERDLVPEIDHHHDVDTCAF